MVKDLVYHTRHNVVSHHLSTLVKADRLVLLALNFRVGKYALISRYVLALKGHFLL